MLGDSTSNVGSATGAGDDVIMGEAGIDVAAGDSQAAVNAHGSGGDDLINLGADGGDFALGDHNIFEPVTGGRATGAGNDEIFGGAAGEILTGDSSVVDFTVTAAGNDHIIGAGGNDTLLGDNGDFEATTSVGTAGGNDELDAGDGIDKLRAGPANDHLDGGDGSPDDCDGEAGTDEAERCEILAGIP
jgi:Ca2+-binding RTX toxin-like protein